jgi:hypothetical protein
MFGISNFKLVLYFDIRISNFEAKPAFPLIVPWQFEYLWPSARQPSGFRQAPAMSLEQLNTAQLTA